MPLYSVFISFPETETRGCAVTIHVQAPNIKEAAEKAQKRLPGYFEMAITEFKIKKVKE